MPMITVELTKEMREKLTELATEDCRPVAWHADWILREGIRRGYRALKQRRAREAANGVQAQAQAGVGTEQVGSAARV